MESPDSFEAPAYVPDAFQEEHLDEARRTVANSRGLRAAARRVTRPVNADDASQVMHRWLPFIYGAHVLAAVLALAFALATSTLGVGAFIVVAIGVSAVALRALLRTLVRQHFASDDRSAPDPPA